MMGEQGCEARVRGDEWYGCCVRVISGLETEVGLLIGVYG